MRARRGRHVDRQRVLDRLAHVQRLEQRQLVARGRGSCRRSAAGSSCAPPAACRHQRPSSKAARALFTAASTSASRPRATGAERAAVDRRVLVEGLAVGARRTRWPSMTARPSMATAAARACQSVRRCHRGRRSEAHHDRGAEQVVGLAVVAVLTPRKTGPLAPSSRYSTLKVVFSSKQVVQAQRQRIAVQALAATGRRPVAAIEGHSGRSRCGRRPMQRRCRRQIADRAEDAAAVLVVLDVVGAQRAPSGAA